jgi:DNA-binding transcriptional LysR family regulator
VRLTASGIVAVEVLPTRIARFRAAHPNVSVDLAASDREDDLLSREAYLAVRMRRPRQPAPLRALRDHLAAVLPGAMELA